MKELVFSDCAKNVVIFSSRSRSCPAASFKCGMHFLMARSLVISLVDMSHRQKRMKHSRLSSMDIGNAGWSFAFPQTV